MLRLLFSMILLGLGLAPALAFDLQGHRGARGLMPENTLPAFAKALSIGVTTLELDVGITKDAVVVVSHDPSLNKDLTRDATGAWISKEMLIRSLDYADLQVLDVGRARPGSRTASGFTRQQAVDGARIPSLSQVFELVKRSGNEMIHFNIETKINPLKPTETVDPATFSKILVETVLRHKMQERVSIQSFDWRTLQHVQILNPAIRTVYLSVRQDWMNTIDGKAGDWTAGFANDGEKTSVPELIKTAGGSAWSPYYGDLTPESLAAAQYLGLDVIPWTVNDEAVMKALIELGVDGIITDYPDRLRDVMKELGLKLPQPTPVEFR